MGVDPRLQGVLDYITNLTQAQSKAITAGDIAKAQGLDDPIRQANKLKDQVNALIMAADDVQLAAITTTIKGENDKLKNFQKQISSLVSDVDLAAKIGANIANIIKMIGAL